MVAELKKAFGIEDVKKNARYRLESYIIDGQTVNRIINIEEKKKTDDFFANHSELKPIHALSEELMLSEDNDVKKCARALTSITVMLCDEGKISIARKIARQATTLNDRIRRFRNDEMKKEMARLSVKTEIRKNFPEWLE